MGKASKWLINFLLGRKEDKGKKKSISISFEDHGRIPPASPFRRIWSFGKSATKSGARASKSSRSFDPLSTASDMENQHANAGVVSMATYEAFLMSKAIENAAATRIQGAFRSYLARKALHALKGLVKLQALVRGYLVRKKTTATLQCMHALMVIQIRARFERIQMATKSHLGPKSRLSSRHGRFPLETRFERAQKDGKRGVIKSQNGTMNPSKTEKMDRGITRCYSEELSIPKKKQNYEEFSLPNSPIHCPPLKSKPTTPGRSSFSSYEYPCMPSYMANTQSSRAKVRSQSEPKQRPASNFKAQGKRTASAEEMNINNMQQH